MSASTREYSDSDDSYLESNPLYGHPRYAPVKTLSSGPAGSLQVGLERRSCNQASVVLPTASFAPSYL